MPRGDGTGPAGFGPMTGRAAGYCAGYSVPGFANPIIGRGRFGGGIGRFGGGRGRGFRHMYYSGGFPGFGGGYYPNNVYTQPVITPEQEVESLKQQAKLMQENLESINQRIQELENIETKIEKPKK